MMKYRGYGGLSRVDVEAGVIRGIVDGITDTITFQGASVAEAKRAFEESVDDYLEFCRSLGRAPEKPFSGKMLVRVTPEVHRKLSLAAQVKGVSVNHLVGVQLKRLTRATPDYVRSSKVIRPAGDAPKAAAPAQLPKTKAQPAQAARSKGEKIKAK